MHLRSFLFLEPPGHASCDVRSFFPYPPPVSCLLWIVCVCLCHSFALLGASRSLLQVALSLLAWRVAGFDRLSFLLHCLTMRWSAGRSYLAWPLLVFPASDRPLLGPAHIWVHQARACLPFRVSCDIPWYMDGAHGLLAPLAPRLIWTVISRFLFLLSSPLYIYLAS